MESRFNVHTEFRKACRVISAMMVVASLMGFGSAAYAQEKSETSTPSSGAGATNVETQPSGLVAPQASAEQSEKAPSAAALRTNPNEEAKAPAGFEAAVKLYNDKKFAQAAAMLEKFVASGGANSDVHLYLGGCYQQLKKYDKALEQYDWVAKNGKLISTKNKGSSAAHYLRCYRAGVCPGPCLKLSMSGWAHYPGLDPNLLWMKYTYSGGWHAWSTNHLGEVIEYVHGEPVNKGKCRVCGGTGKVPKLQ